MTQLPSVQCIDCQHFTLQADRGMAGVGYGHCDLDPAGRFQSAIFERTCSSFEAADEATRTRRRLWLAGKLRGVKL